MSDIKHPAIELPIAEISPERHLAEEAFFLMTSMGMQHVIEHDGAFYSLPVTDRIDITSEEAGRRALRLSGVPVFTTDSGMNEVTSSSGYSVLNIEEGICVELPQLNKDGIDPTFDEDFTWGAYVTLIMNTQDHDDVTVVDAYGNELDDSDLTQARFVLDHMRQEYRNQHYEEVLGEAAEQTLPEPVIVPSGMGYQKPFEPGVLAVIKSFDVNDDGDTVLPGHLLQ